MAPTATSSTSSSGRGRTGGRTISAERTLKQRSRFAAEVVRAVRAAVGPDFPLILRVSQWKQQDYAFRLAETPQLMTDWLAPLVEAGVDVLHCSQRRFWEPEFPNWTASRASISPAGPRP